MPAKKKAAGNKKKTAIPSIPSPSPLSSLLSSHHTMVPRLLSSFPTRSDLLFLDLHLLTFPSLTLTLLLSSSSTLQSVSHAIHRRHGPSSSLRLFRSPSEDDELSFDPWLSLEQLGCSGGRREEGRRYQLWYDVLSEVKGGVCMKEVREVVAPHRTAEPDDPDSGDGDGLDAEDERDGMRVSVTRLVTLTERRQIKDREQASLEAGAARVQEAQAQLQSAFAIRPRPATEESAVHTAHIAAVESVPTQALDLSMAWS